MSDAAPQPETVLDARAWCMLAAALRLSPRELEIARGIFRDEKDVAIAGRLGISPHTVHTHVERLYHKLGVHSRVELVLHIVQTYLQLVSDSHSDPDASGDDPPPASVPPSTDG